MKNRFIIFFIVSLCSTISASIPPLLSSSCNGSFFINFEHDKFHLPRGIFEISYDSCPHGKEKKTWRTLFLEQSNVTPTFSFLTIGQLVKGEDGKFEQQLTLQLGEQTEITSDILISRKGIISNPFYTPSARPQALPTPHLQTPTQTLNGQPTYYSLTTPPAQQNYYPTPPSVIFNATPPSYAAINPIPQPSYYPIPLQPQAVSYLQTPAQPFNQPTYYSLITPPAQQNYHPTPPSVIFNATPPSYPAVNPMPQPGQYPSQSYPYKVSYPPTHITPPTQHYYAPTETVTRKPTYPRPQSYPVVIPRQLQQHYPLERPTQNTPANNVVQQAHAFTIQKQRVNPLGTETEINLKQRLAALQMELDNVRSQAPSNTKNDYIRALSEEMHTINGRLAELGQSSLPADTQNPLPRTRTVVNVSRVTAHRIDNVPPAPAPQVTSSSSTLPPSTATLTQPTPETVLPTTKKVTFDTNLPAQTEVKESSPSKITLLQQPQQSTQKREEIIYSDPAIMNVQRGKATDVLPPAERLKKALNIGQQPQEEQERKAKEEQERKAKEEQERKAREELERKAKEEQERKAKEEQERKAKEEQERKAKEEQERKAKEEQECKAKEEQERKAKEELEHKAKEELEHKAREEQERKAKAKEAKLKAKAEEAKLKAKAEQKRIAKKEEQKRLATAEQERKAKEEEQKLKAREDQERKAQAEQERIAKEEEAKLKTKADQERKAKAEEEKEGKRAKFRKELREHVEHGRFRSINHTTLISPEELHDNKMAAAINLLKSLPVESTPNEISSTNSDKNKQNIYGSIKYLKEIAAHPEAKIEDLTTIYKTFARFSKHADFAKTCDILRTDLEKAGIKVDTPYDLYLRKIAKPESIKDKQEADKLKQELEEELKTNPNDELLLVALKKWPNENDFAAADAYETAVQKCSLSEHQVAFLKIAKTNLENGNLLSPLNQQYTALVTKKELEIKVSDKGQLTNPPAIVTRVPAERQARLKHIREKLTDFEQKNIPQEVLKSLCITFFELISTTNEPSSIFDIDLCFRAAIGADLSEVSNQLRNIIRAELSNNLKSNGPQEIVELLWVTFYQMIAKSENTPSELLFSDVDLCFKAATKLDLPALQIQIAHLPFSLLRKYMSPNGDIDKNYIRIAAMVKKIMSSYFEIIERHNPAVKNKHIEYFHLKHLIYKVLGKTREEVEKTITEGLQYFPNDEFLKTFKTETSAEEDSEFEALSKKFGEAIELSDMDLARQRYRVNKDQSNSPTISADYILTRYHNLCEQAIFEDDIKDPLSPDEQEDLLKLLEHLELEDFKTIAAVDTLSEQKIEFLKNSCKTFSPEKIACLKYFRVRQELLLRENELKHTAEREKLISDGLECFPQDKILLALEKYCLPNNSDKDAQKKYYQYLVTGKSDPTLLSDAKELLKQGNSISFFHKNLQEKIEKEASSSR